MKKFTKNIFESLSEPCYGLLVVLAGNRWGDVNLVGRR